MEYLLLVLLAFKQILPFKSKCWCTQLRCTQATTPPTANGHRTKSTQNFEYTRVRKRNEAKCACNKHMSWTLSFCIRQVRSYRQSLAHEPDLHSALQHTLLQYFSGWREHQMNTTTDCRVIQQFEETSSVQKGIYILIRRVWFGNAGAQTRGALKLQHRDYINIYIFYMAETASAQTKTRLMSIIQMDVSCGLARHEFPHSACETTPSWPLITQVSD